MYPMLCYIQHMARGSSGRLVFEIDPLIKREFHAQLVREGLTAKKWLLEQIEDYLVARQAQLPFEYPSDDSNPASRR